MDTQIPRNYWPIENVKESPINQLKEITPEKFEELKTSLKKFGQLVPLLVDIRDDHYGEALGGKHTLQALRENGNEMIWVEPRKPANDAEAFELAVKHNQQYANYIEDKLLEEAKKYKDELDLSSLEVHIAAGENLDELLDGLDIQGDVETLETTEEAPPEEVVSQATQPVHETVEEPEAQPPQEETPQEPKPEDQTQPITTIRTVTCPNCQSTFTI